MDLFIQQEMKIMEEEKKLEQEEYFSIYKERTTR